MTDQGTGLIRSVGQMGAPIAPVDIPVQQPAASPADDWMARQMAQQAALEAPKPVTQQQQRDAENDARLEELRGQYGAGETIASKFAQGALDALLAPGALVGAGAETVGDVYQLKWLRDFGRGLGEAASGKSAMSAMGGLAQAALEGSAYKGAESMDATEEWLKGAEEARPMLSTISRMAGMAASAAGLGVGAAGESSALATIAANTAEGAAGGAQAAYERAAPLRDVLASAAVGGLLGGGIAAAGEGVAKLAKKTPDLAKVFGEKMQDFADSRALKSVIDRDPKAWKTFMGGGKERIARVAERIRAADVLGKGDEGMLEGLGIAARDAGENLSAVANHLDDAGIVPSVEGLTSKLDAQVAGLRASGSGTEQAIADSLEREVAPFKRKLAVMGTDNFGNEVPIGYRNPTFTELREFKQAMGRAKKALFDSNNAAAEETSRMYGHVAESLNDAAEHAGPQVSRLWRQSNEAYSDLSTLREGLERQMMARMKNRFISPSDYGTSIGAGMATLLMSSNPLTAGLATIGTALGHKAIREGGSAVFSTLANRFARMSHHVSLMKAGGTEAQEILSALGKTKAFMAETAERAGANPTLRQGAEQTAKQVAARELARKAGPFNPATWAEKKLNPLQKVLYRSQVLDAVSGDLSKSAEAIAALHPQLPEQLDLRRLTKLTKDANGPEAIGALQSLVAESAKAAPATASGDAAAVALRNLGIKLDRVDAPGAMQEAHAVANWLRDAQEIAEPSAGKLSDEARIVSSRGLENARYLKSGMRDESMAQVRAEMASGGPVRPVDVTIFPGDDIVLQDGRHRLAVAKELGLGELPARISRMDEEGNIVSEVYGNVTVQPGSPNPESGAREYLRRTEQAIRGALSDSNWGKAGQAYSQMVAPPHEALGVMADPEKLRAALAVGGNDLRGTAEQVHQRLADAYAARAQLSGMPLPDDFTKHLSAGKRIFEAAEEALTLDGKPMSEALGNLSTSTVYGTGADQVDTNTVQKEVDKGIDHIAPVIRGDLRRQTVELGTTEAVSREQYDQRMKTLTQVTSSPDKMASAPGMYASISGFAGQALSQLMQDIPKTQNSIHGKPFETMSQDDLRLANAMWEATTEPLTVLSDLAAGRLDPDKSAYAWKQYPGLQRAVQAGVVDELMGLNEEQRANVPESVLSQLDTAIGFNGALQDANQPDFAARMSQLYQPAPNKPQPGGTLKTPLAEPTYTQRLSGQE